MRRKLRRTGRGLGRVARGPGRREPRAGAGRTSAAPPEATPEPKREPAPLPARAPSRAPTPARPRAGARARSGREPEPPPEDATKILGPIERLPPSAFPAQPVRGIHGGSLWMTFHGQQWPYYPKTGDRRLRLRLDRFRLRANQPRESRAGDKTGLAGRLLLRVTPTWSNGEYFVQGQAELVANKDQSLHQPDIGDADDVWLKAGKWKSWDVQLGRYESWEIYHLGMGLDLFTLERNGATDEAFGVPGIYGVTYDFYRPAGVGQAAVHLFPTNYFESSSGRNLAMSSGRTPSPGAP